MIGKSMMRGVTGVVSNASALRAAPVLGVRGMATERQCK
jgi:hypothetical protein